MFKDYFSEEARERREQRQLEHKKENTKQLKVVGWFTLGFVAIVTAAGALVAKGVKDAVDTD